DSGALYRLLGLSLHNKQLLDQLSDQLDECVKIAQHLDIQFNTQSGGISIDLDGQDVTKTIRTEHVGEYASKVAAVPELRQALFDRQRA
ncbi:(d)CMP kinase, partial [Acinetobacter baumannii]